jgi:hypothetical protein
MRTTLTIDDDILLVARQLAGERSEPIGKVVSDLAALGLQAATRTQGKTASGFPVFSVFKNSHAFTLADVRSAEDEA